MQASTRCGEAHAACGGSRPRLTRAVAWLQGVTLAWMMLECGGALLAAARAHSVALLAFGADSLVELLSAVVVLLQFVPRFSVRKSQAERAAAVLLYALAGVVVLIALLARHAPRETSLLGMALTALALAGMPVLAWAKRRQARACNNRVLAADAAQSATCAYLAAVTLTGLVAYAWLHITWLDSAAALLAVPLLCMEARRTWRGEGCGCC